MGRRCPIFPWPWYSDYSRPYMQKGAITLVRHAKEKEDSPIIVKKKRSPTCARGLDM